MRFSRLLGARRLVIRSMCLSFLLLSFDVFGVTFAPGNLLVQWQTPGSSNYQISEYDFTGSELQSLSIPQPPGQTDLMHARDLALDGNGSLHLYNGTFDPYLSSYNLSSDSWSHTTTSGWSTVNNVSYGGLATFSDLVFVTDMSTAGAGDSASGIIAFDTVGMSVTRFATATNPIDLNVGLNGLLYALSGSTVSAYNPDTFGLIGSVGLNVAGDYRTIAADAAGNIYAATWGGSLIKYDSSGTLIDSIETTGSAIDIDVSIDGTIALGTRLNGIFITDTNFSSSSSFDNGGWNSFVTFTPVPLPASIWLFVTGLLGLIGISRRKNTA